MNRKLILIFAYALSIWPMPSIWAQVYMKVEDLSSPPVLVNVVASKATEISTLRRCFTIAQPYLDRDDEIKQIGQSAWNLFDQQQLVFAYPDEKDKEDYGMAYTVYGAQFIDQKTLQPLSIKASIRFSDRAIKELAQLAKITNLSPLDIVHIIDIITHEFKHVIDKYNNQSYVGGRLEFESHGYRIGARAVLLLVDGDPERITAPDHYNELRFSRAQKRYPKDTFEWVGLMLYMAGNEVEKIPIDGYNAKFNAITDKKDLELGEDRSKVLEGLAEWVTDLESKGTQIHLGANYQTFLLNKQLIHLNSLLGQLKRFAEEILTLDWQEVSGLQEKLNLLYQKVNQRLTEDCQNWSNDIKPGLWR